MQKAAKHFVREVRRARHVSAWIVLDGKAQCECQVMDLSSNGAKIVVAAPSEVPPRFSLTFLQGERSRRECEVIWKRGKTLGIKFAR